VPTLDSVPVDSEPEVGFVPLHAPLAVQLVALAEFQVSVELPPCTRAAGAAVSVSVGTGCVTLTVTVRDAVPPAPVQVSTKSVATVNAPLTCVPDVAFVPAQPPDAVQLVALLADQLRVVVPPDSTEVGVAVKLIDGTGGGVTWTCVTWAAVPPGPVHVSVYVCVAVRAPVDWLPDVAFAPDQPPDAVQLVALVADQVSVLLPP